METNTHIMQRYQAWLNDPAVDEETKKELNALAGNDKEIEDRFYKDLEFGTGGLRGVIGAGTNRMNVYTVGIATQGLAQYVLERSKQPSCVIAHDSRHQSPEFALRAALVLAANGVKTYVFESLRPTPELSFAVRELNATCGIVITASHNPPEYNGYKVYNHEGGQLVPNEAQEVISHIRKIDTLDAVKLMTREEAERDGKLIWIGEKLDQRYVEEVTKLSFNQDGSMRKALESIKIMYTPLHGSGNQLVRQALDAIGATQVRIVPEQEQPDPDFSTVKSPNPEERDAFHLAIKQAQSWEADIIVGTDPDADRMGAVVKHQGEYHTLTGNQSGALMIHYVCSRLQAAGQLPSNGAVVKTIVTSEMGAQIARSYGLTVLNTLTGFKYIGERMNAFKRTGEHTFVFGYEESYGYLAGDYARDKDAVLATMLICEAAAYYKEQGKTLMDVLEELYQQYGWYLEQLESRTLKGKEGMMRIKQIMSQWREQTPDRMAGIPVKEVLDYSQGIDGLPRENVMKFILDDGSWFCIRPSGTEPKIKIYVGVCGNSKQDAIQRQEDLCAAVMKRMES